MKSFEIQTMRDGRWGIDSVFNDRELALFEARRVAEGKRYAGVRVIEEIYDEGSGLTTTRTIFRGSKAIAQSRDKPPRRQGHGGPAAYHQGVEYERVPRRREPAPPRKKSSTLVMVLVVLLLMFMGLAGLLGLHLLSKTIA